MDKASCLKAMVESSVDTKETIENLVVEAIEILIEMMRHMDNLVGDFASAIKALHTCLRYCRCKKCL